VLQVQLRRHLDLRQKAHEEIPLRSVRAIVEHRWTGRYKNTDKMAFEYGGDLLWTG
jgi:hypothetical protein